MAERSDMADDPWKLLAKTNVLKDAPVPNARLEVVEGKVKWQPKKDYVHKSCGNLRVTNPVRKLTIKIVEHPFFEGVVLTTIMINCIILALYDPLKPMDEGRNVIISQSEVVFVIIFTTEMVIKMIAFGVIADPRPPMSYSERNERMRVPPYLRDGWNILDFVVVVTSLISLFPGVDQNLSALRTVRVLRPLRTISILSGMRVLVGTIIESIPMIGNVLLMCVFLFTVFGILGIQVFKGVLRYRCFVPLDTGNSTTWEVVDEEQMCTQRVQPWHGWLCHEDVESSSECKNFGENPNAGVTSFDNIFYSSLTIFQCITLEGWTQIMYMCMDATTGWSFLYFLFLVFLGAFFLLNLALGVITEMYEQKDQEMEEQRKLDEEEEQRLRIAELALQGKTLSMKEEEERRAEEELRMLETTQGDAVGFRPLCRSLIQTAWFPNLIVLMIVINTVVLAMEYHGMSTMYEAVVDLINLVLTFIFLAEMIIKITALGIKKYLEDRFNIFDAIVVMVSILEFVLSFTAAGDGSGGGLSAFRAFRILRVLKLINSWSSLKDFITVLFGTIKELGNFCLIVILVVFIFSLLGMQVFGGRFVMLEDGVPRHNFDTLVWAAVTVFQILTGEDWNQVMYDGVRATSMWSTLYFVALIVIGDFMILNLFIAILLSNFSNPKGDDEPEQGEPASHWQGRDLKASGFLAKAKHGMSWFATLWKSAPPAANQALDQAPGEDGAAQAQEDGPGSPVTGEGGFASFKERRVQRMSLGTTGSLADWQEDHDMELVVLDSPWTTYGGAAPRQAASVERVGIRWGPLRRFKGAQPYGYESFVGRSLGILPTSRWLRRVCYEIADDKRFDMFMMLMIFASSISIAVETPWMDAEKELILLVLDIIFTTFFCIEMAVKVISLGLLMKEYSYLRDGWNVLDCLVVLFSIVSLSLTSLDLTWVKTFRALRVLRPLRVINRIPELKVVVNALFASLPGLGNVLVVSTLFWIIFGILGMQLFLGAFYACSAEECFAPLDAPATAAAMGDRGYPNCTDAFVAAAAESTQFPLTYNTSVCCVEDAALLRCQVKMADQCLGFDADELPCEWQNADMNFDNIFQAMKTLFEMATTEGWTAVMYQGVDAVGIDYQPRVNAHVVMVLYFIAFMIIGYFFMVNLFVGIILDKFSEEHKGGNPLLTKQQLQWVETHMRMMNKPLKQATKEPANHYRRWLFRIVDSNVFDFVIMVCIIINVIFMAMEHYNQSETWDNMQQIVNIVFTVIFTAEAGLKILGLGVAEYFSRGANCFDFVLVLMSLLGIALSTGVGTNFVRIFRIARVFRLIKSLKGLRILLTALVVSVPTLINVAGLGFLLLFMYAVLGVSLFGRVVFGEELNRHANFRGFGVALLTLVRIITGEAWNSIMYDCMVEPPLCDPSDEPYCAQLDASGQLVWEDGRPVAAPGVEGQADCDCFDCSWREGWDIDNCGSRAAPFYFISYFVLGAFIMLNLIIAVVLENFSNSKSSSEDEITEEVFAQLRKAWMRYDPDAKGFIRLEDLPRLVSIVPPPLGLEGTDQNRARMRLFQKELHVSPVGGRIYWHDLLQAMFLKVARKNQMSAEALPEEVRLQLEKFKDMSSHKFSQAASPKAKDDGQVLVGGKPLTVADAYSLTYLQAAVRGFLARRRFEKQAMAREHEMRLNLANSISVHLCTLLDHASQAHELHVPLQAPPALDLMYATPPEADAVNRKVSSTGTCGDSPSPRPSEVSPTRMEAALRGFDSSPRSQRKASGGISSRIATPDQRGSARPGSSGHGRPAIGPFDKVPCDHGAASFRGQVAPVSVSHSARRSAPYGACGLGTDAGVSRNLWPAMENATVPEPAAPVIVRLGRQEATRGVGSLRGRSAAYGNGEYGPPLGSALHRQDVSDSVRSPPVSLRMRYSSSLADPRDFSS